MFTFLEPKASTRSKGQIYIKLLNDTITQNLLFGICNFNLLPIRCILSFRWIEVLGSATRIANEFTNVHGNGTTANQGRF